jgi:hypothetical protein
MMVTVELPVRYGAVAAPARLETGRFSRNLALATR